MVSPEISVCELLCQFVPWAHWSALFDAMGESIKACQANLEICKLTSDKYQIGPLGSLRYQTNQTNEITVLLNMMTVMTVMTAGSYQQYWDYAELTNGAAGRRYVGAEDRAEGKRHIEQVRNSAWQIDLKNSTDFSINRK